MGKSLAKFAFGVLLGSSLLLNQNKTYGSELIKTNNTQELNLFEDSPRKIHSLEDLKIYKSPELATQENLKYHLEEEFLYGNRKKVLISDGKNPLEGFLSQLENILKTKSTNYQLFQTPQENFFMTNLAQNQLYENQKKDILADACFDAVKEYLRNFKWVRKQRAKIQKITSKRIKIKKTTFRFGVNYDHENFISPYIEAKNLWVIDKAKLNYMFEKGVKFTLLKNISKNGYISLSFTSNQEEKEKEVERTNFYNSEPRGTSAFLNIAFKF